MEQTYAPDEVAKALSVSVETVKHWIRTGELSAFNVSRDRRSGKPRLRVRQCDLDAFLATRATQKPTESRRPVKRPPIKRMF